MSDPSIRILSDIHYGDQASGVRALAQVRPLFDFPGRLLLNGDTLDTRPSARPDHSRRVREDVDAFLASIDAPVTVLTGNHDPDYSDRHAFDLAAGEVFVTHGDIVFDEIVPWGRDGPTIRKRMRSALEEAALTESHPLEDRLRILRRVAASIVERHQSERDPLKYALRLAADTVWPPWRILRIFRAWQVFPGRAEALTLRYRPAARFAVVGHTHWPGVWRMPSGITVVNTGSFCPPVGGFAVDLEAGRLVVRRIERVRGEFRTGRAVCQFALAKTADFAQKSP